MTTQTATATASGIIDNTDIAYMAIGAAAALGRLPSDENNRLIDLHGGQFGVILDVIRHAQLLADIYAEQNNEFPGVWYYEIAEPFGTRYIEAIAAGKTVDAGQLIRDLVREAA